MFVFFSYVSRSQSRDSANHIILGTQQFKPTEFANQINLNMDNAWGVLRCVIDICMKLKEGKYLIMKDPNKVSDIKELTISFMNTVLQIILTTINTCSGPNET